MRRTAWFALVAMAVACDGGVDPANDSTQDPARLRLDPTQPDVHYGGGFCEVNPSTGALTGRCIVDSDWGCLRKPTPRCAGLPSGVTGTMPACGPVVVDTQRRCILIVPG